MSLFLEGISRVQDLINCNENMLDSLEDHLRKLGQGSPRFVFSPVSKNRMLQTSELMMRCQAIGRIVAVTSIACPAGNYIQELIAQITLN